MAALALFALPLTASRAAAQGFGVYEHDACSMGRAGTGVAAPCNASAIFFNPAGIVNPANSTTKWNVAAGATSIGANFAFQDSVSGITSNSTGGNVLVPNAHVTMQYHGNWAFGVGLFAPYGLVSEWPTTNFTGRFLGYRSELKSIYIQPTAAWHVKPWLRLGAGWDYIHTTVDLQQRVDLSGQQANALATFGQLGIPANTDFADAHLTGKSNSGAFHLGILLTPTENVSIGIRYLTRSTADIQGTSTFAQVPTNIVLSTGNPICNPPAGPPTCPANTPLDSVLAPQFRGTGALVTQHASTRVALPDQLVFGLAIKFTQKLSTQFDFQWVNWSSFQTLGLQFEKLPARTLYEDYHDTHGIRFGVEYVLTDKITVRGGLLQHEGAAPSQTVTPLLPEAQRAEQTLGASIRLSRNGSISLAYQHINQADRRGRVVDAPRFSTANNTGLYTGSADLFGASLAWGF
jgi:long-chain fatty acid transport protein